MDNDKHTNTDEVIDKPKYVAEIDGLRAFAVVVVLLFHAFPRAFPGGFIGVDVFFTISGFVIARAYLSRLMSGETTLKKFFIRRIRRLAPACAVVLVVSTVLAMVLLAPSKLNTYGVSLASQIVYLQNVTFWLEGNYFEAALSKPLLHTWSLAVEEQFYLLFGLIIVLLRWQKKLFWPLLVGGFCVSLVGGHLLTTLSPKTAFYLMPFRVWEFVAGVLAFIVAERLNKTKAGLVSNVLSALALVGVVVSVFAFDEKAHFPGPQSWLSTLSVFVLLVLFDSRVSPLFKPLKHAIARHIGELSYSLYLWHWPFIVFASYYLGREMSWIEASLALVVSYVFSLFSYRYVENPIRFKTRLKTTPMLLRAWVVSSIILAACGLGMVLSKGGVFRYKAPLKMLYTAAQGRSPQRCAKFWRVTNVGSEFCPINDAAKSGSASGVLLLGDSEADQVDEVFAEAGQKMGSAVYLATRNCDLNQFGQSGYCSKKVFENIAKQAKKANIKTIIAISDWVTDHNAKKSLEPWVGLLVKKGFTVHIAYMIPICDELNPLKQALSIEQGGKFVGKCSYAKYAKSRTLYAQEFKAIDTKYPQVHLIDPSPAMCNKTDCRMLDDGQSMYWDERHLTRFGAQKILPYFKDALDVSGSTKK